MQNCCSDEKFNHFELRRLENVSRFYWVNPVSCCYDLTAPCRLATSNTATEHVVVVKTRTLPTYFLYERTTAWGLLLHRVNDFWHTIPACLDVELACHESSMIVILVCVTAEMYFKWGVLGNRGNLIRILFVEAVRNLVVLNLRTRHCNQYSMPFNGLTTFNIARWIFATNAKEWWHYKSVQSSKIYSGTVIQWIFRVTHNSGGNLW